MTKKSPGQILKDIELLKKAGIQTPIAAEAMLRQEDMKKRGIKQYYRCQYCKTDNDYESPVNVKWINCPNGHAMKKIWQF